MLPGECRAVWSVGPGTGIAVLFLALIRGLDEYFRLKQVQGVRFVPADAEVFVLAALIVAVLTSIGVAALLLRRPRWSIACATFPWRPCSGSG